MDSWTELDADDWAILRAAELARAGEPARIVIQWLERSPLVVERIGVKRANGEVEWWPRKP